MFKKVVVEPSFSALSPPIRLGPHEAARDPSPDQSLDFSGQVALPVRFCLRAHHAMQNGSERFCSGNEVHGNIRFLLLKVLGAAQDPKQFSKDTRKRERELLRSLGIVGGGWGPYCQHLTRDERLLLNSREKVKVDVEVQRMKEWERDLGQFNVYLCDLKPGSVLYFD